MKAKMNTLYREDTRKPASEYTRRQAAKATQLGAVMSVVGDKSHWCAHIDHYVLTVRQSKQFWKKTNTVSCTYKDGKLYGSIEPFADILCKIFRLDWVSTNKWTLTLLKGRRDLWIACLKGKVTSPEKLCKYISKKYFGGAYSYPTLRRTAEEYFNAASLWDLVDYTTNPELALVTLLEAIRVGKNYYLLTDVLQNCRILNTKMNPKWSEKRLQEEHQKQIEEINLMEVESLSSSPIMEKFSCEGLSLIDNERDCYLEGCAMHNCVHSCYWNQIKKGQYLIAKGSINEEYLDLGMRVGNYGITLDQVHTSYNRSVSEHTRDYCEQWISNHEEELLRVAETIKRERQKYIDPEVIEAIPF